MNGAQASDIARRALACLDLTALADDMAAAAVAPLAARALTRHGAVAAICTWPRFAAAARAALGPSSVKLASVANFPAGAARPAEARAEASRAIADGADEIDLVFPWRAFLAGDRARAGDVVAAVADALPARARLKVILETGGLARPDSIVEAAALAVAHGAHMLKTSTGKISAGATPEAARLLFAAATSAPRPVGVKVSGGVRTLADAATYLALADEAFGRADVLAATFRIGASGLLDHLLAALDGGPAPAPAKGY
ncbi:MAG: deoxyribose-phosphate aldolase [Hyphomicrobiales bacterium]|nr:deoxyribose-phosphate aldolase [Hyphomicrobiales bacterium]